MQGHLKRSVAYDVKHTLSYNALPYHISSYLNWINIAVTLTFTVARTFDIALTDDIAPALAPALDLLLQLL